MKKYLSLLAVVFTFYSCNKQTPQNSSTETNGLKTGDSIKTEHIAGSAANGDTATHYILIINGAKYYLALKESEVDNINTEENPSVTVSLKNASTNQLILNQLLPYNMIGDIENPAPNKYWLSLILSGGGSGYYGTLFDIVVKDTVTLRPLLDFNEVFYWKSNKAANEILVFQGIWDLGNIDSDDFESHFSAHKQVELYHITNDTVLVNELGTTQDKYSFDEEPDALSRFRNSDPLSSKIKWADYN